MAGIKSEFDKRNCKILGLSVDPVGSHAEWAKDIEETQGHAVNYPLIGDPELTVAKLYDMLPAEAVDAPQVANHFPVFSGFGLKRENRARNKHKRKKKSLQDGIPNAYLFLLLPYCTRMVSLFSHLSINRLWKSRLRPR